MAMPDKTTVFVRYILSGVFHMGAAGAAIATVFAQAVSVLLSLIIIQRREIPFNFSLKYVRPKGIYIKEILKLDIPIALQDLLAGIFAKDTEIIMAAADYLKAYAIDCVLTSFLFCFIGYFNGCSHTTFVMLQGVICAFGLRIPISWLMSKQIPVSLFHIGLAVPASTVVQIILCVGFLVIMSRKQYL